MPSFRTPETEVAPVQLPPRDLSRLRPLELGFAIDKSSSMAPWCGHVVSGYNVLITEQRALAPAFSVSQVQFSNQVETVFESVPVDQMPTLSLSIYRPWGNTALLDGIGAIMLSVGERFDRSEQGFNVLIAILSDGAENSSKKYRLDEIQNEIAFRQNEDNWQFVFLAAGFSAAEYARKLGIRNIVLIDGDMIGVTLKRLSDSITRYRLSDRKRFYLG